MQHRHVPLIAEGAQHPLLRPIRVLDQRQRLIGVAGKDNLVEFLDTTLAILDPDTVCQPGYRLHCRIEPDPVVEARRQAFHVFAAAALNGRPLRTV